MARPLGGGVSRERMANTLMVVKAKGGSADINGTDVKNGFEAISNFTLGGILPPLTITAEDHEGGGWVQMFQVRGEKFVPISEWLHGYRDVVMAMVKGH